jgi:membrane protein YdbS with pleckstrin-like domain
MAVLESKKRLAGDSPSKHTEGMADTTESSHESALPAPFVEFKPGERLVYRGRVSRWIFGIPISLFFLLTIVNSVLAPLSDNWTIPLRAESLMLIAIGIFLIAALLRYYHEDFIVTNQRVIIRHGILTRRILAIFLRTVESVAVEQSVLGRLLSYGDLLVRGTGTSEERFPFLSKPHKFRRSLDTAIQQALEWPSGDDHG